MAQGFPSLIATDSNQFAYGPKGEMAPESALKEAALNRKRQIANLLIQKGLAGAPAGQMVGRFYVPSSPLQHAGGLLQTLGGVLGNRYLDDQQGDISKADQQMVADAIAAHQEKRKMLQGAQQAPVGSGDPQATPPPPQQGPYNGEVGGIPQPEAGVQSEKPPIPPTPAPLLNAAANTPTQGLAPDVTPGDMSQFAQAPAPTTDAPPPAQPAPPMPSQAPAPRKQTIDDLVGLLTHQHPQVRAYGQLMAAMMQRQEDRDIQAQQAQTLKKLENQLAMQLKGTPSADAQAKLAQDDRHFSGVSGSEKAKLSMQEKLHGTPSGNALVQAADQVSILGPDGKPMANRPAIDAKRDIAAAGAAKQQTIVNSYTPASEEAQKEYMKKAAETRSQLQAAPMALKNIEAAKALIPQAKGFMGPGGESLMEASKFLNNRLGMNIKTEGIKSAEELRSRIFFNIMDNLKKMDAQPSEMQQKIMMESLGKLGTDPNALPAVLDAFGEAVRGKVDVYNKDVQGAIDRGVKFPYDPMVQLEQRVQPPAPVSTQPGKVAPYTDAAKEQRYQEWLKQQR